jgi:hypothetical protein
MALSATVPIGPAPVNGLNQLGNLWPGGICIIMRIYEYTCSKDRARAGRDGVNDRRASEKERDAA